MKVIWKFEFCIEDRIRIKMPREARILSIQMQRDTPCMWALVQPARPIETREFVIVGTGHERNIEWWNVLTHIATFQDGNFVWHVFEVAQ